MRAEGRNVFLGGNKVEINLIRHLPTEWNNHGYLQGKRDISVSFPLTNETLKEIQKNKYQLDSLAPFDCVFASSLKRTKETANVYGFDFLTIDPLLDELDFGDFEGKTKDVLLKAYGNKWLKTPLDLVLGESLVGFQRRIITFLSKYRKLDSILIFGHGSWARALLSFAENGDIQHMNQLTVENNKLIQIEIHHSNCLV